MKSAGREGETAWTVRGFITVCSCLSAPVYTLLFSAQCTQSHGCLPVFCCSGLGCSVSQPSLSPCQLDSCPSPHLFL